LKIELIDASGKVMACQASDAPVKPVDTEAINVQAYWEQPAPPPAATAGMHRIALNVAPQQRGFGGGGGRRTPPPSPVDACHPAGTPAPTSEANPQRRGRGTSGLQPGEYTIKLTVDGQTYSHPVTIKPDPRNLAAGAEAPAGEDDDNQ
jgi:hypothetical protein